MELKFLLPSKSTQPQFCTTRPTNLRLVFLWLEVLDNGSIQEFDRPLSLLQIDGALNKIVQQLGAAEAAALLEAAKQVKFRAALEGKFATQTWPSISSGSDESCLMCFSFSFILHQPKYHICLELITLCFLLKAAQRGNGDDLSTMWHVRNDTAQQNTWHFRTFLKCSLYCFLIFHSNVTDRKTQHLNK